MRVSVRSTEATNVTELEAAAKAEMGQVLCTRWRDEWSPFAVTALGSRAGLTALVFSADHRVFDGSSVIELARRYLLLLAHQDPGPAVPDLVPASLEELYPLLAWAVPSAVKLLLGFWALFKVTRGFRLQSIRPGDCDGRKDAVDLTSPRPLGGPGATIISCKTLSVADSSAILGRARAEAVPFSSVLAAATCRAIGRGAPAPSPAGSKSFALINMLDHRRLAPPRVPFPMGNLASTLEVTDDYDGMMTAASLPAAGKRLQARVAGVSIWAALEQMWAWQLLFVPFYGLILRDMCAKYLEGGYNDLMTNATVSNLGLLVEKAPSSTPAGERRRQSSTALISAADYQHVPPVLRFFGAASSVSPSNYPVVFAITVNESLCLTVSGHAVAFSQARLDAFTDAIAEILIDRK